MSVAFLCSWAERRGVATRLVLGGGALFGRAAMSRSGLASPACVLRGGSAWCLAGGRSNYRCLPSWRVRDESVTSGWVAPRYELPVLRSVLVTL